MSESAALDRVDQKSPRSVYSRWVVELEESEKWSKPWRDRGRKVIRRYRDKRLDSAGVADESEQLNILWSNVQTQAPALYARRPKPVVERRYKDNDPVGRTASEVLERATTFVVDDDAFDEVLEQCLSDYLLPGRGSAWVRYIPHTEKTDPPSPPDGVSITSDASEYEAAEGADDAVVAAPGEAPSEKITFEEIAIDYIGWEDFLISPAKTWREVRWVAKRVQMTREELVERFGPAIGKKVELDAKDRSKTDSGIEAPDDILRNEIVSRANVYEIWNKATRRVCWIAKGYPEGPLDEMDDPLKLREFFPCPRPLFATLTTGDLNPIPDFCFYQDQADELDSITGRLARLILACKNTGVYDASQTSLGRLFQEGNDNDFIPVANWPALAQAGGLESVMDFVPLEHIVAAIQQLTLRGEAVKQNIYEITGISDIIRGQSDAAETATAQQIKGQYGALRLKARQKNVARFARDLIAIVAEIISEHFQPQSIALMAGVAEMNQQDQQNFPQAVELLRNDSMRGFRIDIETDSTIAIDEQGDKEAATEFLRAMGEYLGNSLPVAQQAPELLPMLGQGALFLARNMRAGRQLEGSIEQSFQALEQRAQQAAQQPPQPDPAQAEAQAKLEALKATTQAQIQGDAAKFQAEMQMAQQRQAAELQMMQERQAAELQVLMVTTQATIDAKRATVEADLMAKQAKTAVDLETQEARAEGQLEIDRKRAERKPERVQ